MSENALKIVLHAMIKMANLKFALHYFDVSGFLEVV